MYYSVDLTFPQLLAVQSVFDTILFQFFMEIEIVGGLPGVSMEIQHTTKKAGGVIINTTLSQADRPKH